LTAYSKVETIIVFNDLFFHFYARYNVHN